MCREVSIRQILVSELCCMREEGRTLSELLEDASNISRRLTNEGIASPEPLNSSYAGSLNYISPSVSWEISFLNTMGAIAFNFNRVRRPYADEQYRRRMDFLFEDLDSDVKDKLFKCASTSTLT